MPLKDIAIDAGQRNNSGVQYHFGSRDGLIEAVVDHRMPTLETRRLELLADREAAGDADNPRVLVEILVRPLLESGGTHFCRFLDQVRNHPAVSEGDRLSGARRATVRIVLQRLDRSLAGLPAQVRRRRIRWMSTALLALLADHERAVEAGGPEDADYIDDLVDALCGILTARPPSARVPTPSPPSMAQDDDSPG